MAVMRIKPFLLALMLLAGCQESADDASTGAPAALVAGDECHLCGMLIGEFPGPKGELYLRNDKIIKKFCSTRDLFAMVLDPEYQHQVQQIFVHDMAASPWQTPDDSAFIDGKSAWYVVGSEQNGAMGHTFASFSTEAAASDFAGKHGGTVYRFEELSMAML